MLHCAAMRCSYCAQMSLGQGSATKFREEPFLFELCKKTISRAAMHVNIRRWSLINNVTKRSFKELHAALELQIAVPWSRASVALSLICL